MDGVAISHDYCHEGGLIYVSRDHSFHLSELSSGGTKILITSAIILFYPLLFFSSLFRFYEVHETSACGTRSLVHRINAPLCKAVNFHTPLLHGSRNYAKYTAYQLDILRCYKTPFRVLARSFWNTDFKICMGVHAKPPSRKRGTCYLSPTYFPARIRWTNNVYEAASRYSEIFLELDYNGEENCFSHLQ